MTSFFSRSQKKFKKRFFLHQCFDNWRHIFDWIYSLCRWMMADVILCGTGRTFPSHPYFSTQLGPGQLSLFNLLKAYSLLDDEVGYCQGLSFIAGILLMHVSTQQSVLFCVVLTFIHSGTSVHVCSFFCCTHFSLAPPVTGLLCICLHLQCRPKAVTM